MERHEAFFAENRARRRANRANRVQQMARDVVDESVQSHVLGKWITSTTVLVGQLDSEGSQGLTTPQMVGLLAGIEALKVACARTIAETADPHPVLRRWLANNHLPAFALSNQVLRAVPYSEHSCDPLRIATGRIPPNWIHIIGLSIPATSASSPSEMALAAMSAQETPTRPSSANPAPVDMQYSPVRTSGAAVGRRLGLTQTPYSPPSVSNRAGPSGTPSSQTFAVDDPFLLSPLPQLTGEDWTSSLTSSLDAGGLQTGVA